MFKTLVVITDLLGYLTLIFIMFLFPDKAGELSSFFIGYHVASVFILGAFSPDTNSVTSHTEEDTEYENPYSLRKAVKGDPVADLIWELYD